VRARQFAERHLFVSILQKMNKEDILLLYEYDRWANNRVFQAVSALSAEQFARDLGGSYCSVRDALIHIIAGEWGWLAYWISLQGEGAVLELSGSGKRLSRNRTTICGQVVELNYS
jgi:DinB family